MRIVVLCAACVRKKSPADEADCRQEPIAHVIVFASAQRAIRLQRLPTMANSRFAGEMTQGVVFQSSAPSAQSRNAPAIRCHAACFIPPAADFLRALSLMAIRGGFVVRRNAGTLIRRLASGSWMGEGVDCAVAMLFCEPQRPHGPQNRPWK